MTFGSVGPPDVLTFLCKSSRVLASQRPVLESQQPVLAMITAGDRVPEPGRSSYLSTGVAGGLEQRGQPRRAGSR